MRAIKTFIRTKSGRLVEKIVWMTEDDYQAFQAGGERAEDIIRQYLTQEEANGLESWDKVSNIGVDRGGGVKENKLNV